MKFSKRTSEIMAFMVLARRPIRMMIWTPGGRNVWVLSPGVREDPQNVFASIQLNMEFLAMKYYPKLPRRSSWQTQRELIAPLWEAFTERCMCIYDAVAAHAEAPVSIYTDVSAYPHPPILPK